MLWEELQTEMRTEIEYSVTAQVERTVTEQNAKMMAAVVSLRQDVDAVQKHHISDFGSLLQTVKDEHEANARRLEARVAEVEEARKTSQELHEREAREHQHEVQSLKQEVEVLLNNNKDLAKRLEKMEWGFQGMAQLYGGADRNGSPAGQS
jgi:predicted RND superfamily exporter protein